MACVAGHTFNYDLLTIEVLKCQWTYGGIGKILRFHQLCAATMIREKIGALQYVSPYFVKRKSRMHDRDCNKFKVGKRSSPAWMNGKCRLEIGNFFANSTDFRPVIFGPLKASMHEDIFGSKGD